MPLPPAHLGNAQVQPLPTLVPHALLGEPELHHPARVEDDLGDVGLAARSDLAEDAFAKVEEAGPDDALERREVGWSDLARKESEDMCLKGTHNLQDS